MALDQKGSIGGRFMVAPLAAGGPLDAIGGVRKRARGLRAVRGRLDVDFWPQFTAMRFTQLPQLRPLRLLLLP